MKRRRNHFLIGLLSAAITFGTLSAFASRMNWHQRGWGHHCCYGNAGVAGSKDKSVGP